MQTNKPKGVAREAQSVLMRKCAPAVSWYSDALRCAGHSEGHRPKRMVAPRTVRQFAISLGSVVSRIFRTFSLAERHPALAHAVMAPLICWSLSSSMLRYLFVDHAVPAMWRSLAAARLSAD